MDESRLLSTAEVARVLCLSATTVKRYVDDGRLHARLTPGGHRKIPLGEVRRFVRAHDRHPVDWNRLRAAPGPPDPARLCHALQAALAADDGPATRRVLADAYDGGMPVEALADAVIAPAFAAIGHGWEARETAVLHEHRATWVCHAALHDLKARLPAPAADAPVAVGGCPEYDHFALATLLAEMALTGCGWRALDIGPNTPPDAFLAALDAYRPRLLWLSFNHLPDPDRHLAAYRELHARARARGVAVVVGGQALTAPVLARLPGVTHGERLADLVAVARELSPGPPAGRRRLSG